MKRFSENEEVDILYHQMADNKWHVELFSVHDEEGGTVRSEDVGQNIPDAFSPIQPESVFHVE